MKPNVFRSFVQSMCAKWPKWLTVTLIVTVIGVIISFLQLRDRSTHNIEGIISEYVKMNEEFNSVDFPDSLARIPIVDSALKFQMSLRYYNHLIISLNPEDVENALTPDSELTDLRNYLIALKNVTELNKQLNTEFLTLVIASVAEYPKSDLLYRNHLDKKLKEESKFAAAFTNLLSETAPRIYQAFDDKKINKAKKELVRLLTSKAYINFLAHRRELLLGYFQFSNDIILETQYQYEQGRSVGDSAAVDSMTHADN